MGSDRRVFFGAFALCERKLLEGDESKGKKCPDEHKFIVHDDPDSEFCSKCGKKMVAWTEFSSRYESPAMELTEKMKEKLMHVDVDEKRVVFLENHNEEHMTTGFWVPEHDNYFKKATDYQMRSFKKKFKKDFIYEIELLKIRYENVKIEVGILSWWS